jgi:hypothetical protein
MVYDPILGADLLVGGLSCFAESCGANESTLNDTWILTLGVVVPSLSTRVNPAAVCVVGDYSCIAHDWYAKVSITIGSIYSESPSGAAGLSGATLTVLPWGAAKFNASSPFESLCQTTTEMTPSCGLPAKPVMLGNETGFLLSWRPNSWQDTLYVGDVWTVEFEVSVVAPPYGEVPAYACTTSACIANGSGSITQQFSSFGAVAYDSSAPTNTSLPYQGILVDPPQLPSTIISPPITGSPPPPPPVPVGLPGPVTVPSPVTIPTQGILALLANVPSVSLNALAAGVLAAGFARIALQRRSIAQGQPVGNVVRAPRSAFEPERQTDPKLGRIE